MYVTAIDDDSQDLQFLKTKTYKSSAVYTHSSHTPRTHMHIHTYLLTEREREREITKMCGEIDKVRWREKKSY